MSMNKFATSGFCTLSKRMKRRSRQCGSFLPPDPSVSNLELCTPAPCRGREKSFCDAYVPTA